MANFLVLPTITIIQKCWDLKRLGKAMTLTVQCTNIWARILENLLIILRSCECCTTHWRLNLRKMERKSNSKDSNILQNGNFKYLILLNTGYPYGVKIFILAALSSTCPNWHWPCLHWHLRWRDCEMEFYWKIFSINLPIKRENLLK